MTRNVLIIEDNKEITDLLRMHLSDLNCSIRTAMDGLQGLQIAQKGRFDLIILDLMLPQLDGLEICRKIRQQENYTPILMLTAKSSEIDRVIGLEVGADDYLAKPFSIRELMARVKALFRRIDVFSVKTPASSTVIACEELVIDVDKHTVVVDNKQLDLTAKEFELLVQFAKNPGRVYTRSQLLDKVWGYGHDGYEHTVNSHINRLRGKLEKDPANPRFILTVWGVGYKFNPDLA